MKRSRERAASWRLRVSSCVAALMALMAPSATSAEQPGAAVSEIEAMGNLPGRAEGLVALSGGDVVLIEPVKAQRAGRPMTRLERVSEGEATRYVAEPVTFGNPTWSSLKIDHVTEGEDGTLWAVGEDSVVYQRPGELWQLIELPQLDRSSCEEWGEHGVPCQMIVPLGEGRAVTLRPVRQGGRIATEVYAVSQGELRALGSVRLPQVALGPVVEDGEGGFWVMLRRTVQTSNFKPMRGYLHYTPEGAWQMWSDSGEVIEGADLLGKTNFLIDPDVRKMTPDGAGGFFALGQDRLLYRVDRSGESRRFTSAQPICQYCQPVALSWDQSTGRLHMLMGEWREGSGEEIEVLGPVRWLEFSGEDGALLFDEEVALKPGGEGGWREMFSTAVIAAGGGQRWLSAPGALLHRGEAAGWTSFRSPEALASAQRALDGSAPRANDEATQGALLAQLGWVGQTALIGGGFGGSIWQVYSHDPDQGGGTALYTAFYTAGAGTAMGLYPAWWLAESLKPERADASLRAPRLLLGGAATTLLAAVGVVLVGEALATSPGGVEEGVEVSGFSSLSGAPLGGALGGAALGTIASSWLMSRMYRHGMAPSNSLASGAILSAASASLAALGYFLLAPRWQGDVALSRGEAMSAGGEVSLSSGGARWRRDGVYSGAMLRF